MNKADKEELERFRERRKRATTYNNKYNKENYRRMVCMHPIGFSDAIDKAMEMSDAKSVSAYLSMLINRDLKEKGLVD